MTDPSLRDEARAAICEGGDLAEADVRVLEVQERQGQVVAKYIVDGQPFERYEQVEVQG